MQNFTVDVNHDAIAWQLSLLHDACFSHARVRSAWPNSIFACQVGGPVHVMLEIIALNHSKFPQSNAQHLLLICCSKGKVACLGPEC